MWRKGKLLLAAVVIVTIVHKVSFEFCFSLVSKTCSFRVFCPPPLLSLTLSLTPSISHSLCHSCSPFHSLFLSLSQFLFFTLFFQGTAEKNPQLIEAAPHATVPTYIGCRDEALKKFIQSGLLQQELNKSANFKEAWTASERCSEVIPGKLKEHSTALAVFQKGDEFFPDFNKAVKKLSVNATTYEDQFQFKSFYFMLMDLMTKVPPNQCRNVFISTERRVKNGSRVRFESFATAEKETRQLSDFEGGVLLNITSCFYVEANVCNQDTFILSPAEVFIVTEVVSKNDDDDGDYTMIVLNHQSVETSQDCSMFSR